MIYYASKTLNEAQVNYTATEKEFLAIIFALDKFRSYMKGFKVVVHINHASIRHLMAKSDSKPRLIRWVLKLQEFDFEIVYKCGKDNLVADHLSRLDPSIISPSLPIPDDLLDEHPFVIMEEPWFVDIVNYLAKGVFASNMSSQEKKNFVTRCRTYFWDDPYLLKAGKDIMTRRCVLEEEVESILKILLHDATWWAL